MALALTRTPEGGPATADEVRSWVRRSLDAVTGVEHIRLAERGDDLDIAVFVAAPDPDAAGRLCERLGSLLDAAPDRPDGWRLHRP